MYMHTVRVDGDLEAVGAGEVYASAVKTFSCIFFWHIFVFTVQYIIIKLPVLISCINVGIFADFSNAALHRASMVRSLLGRNYIM